jgi:FHA domain
MSAVQLQIMNKCQNCATDNLDSSRFCDECGTRLIAAVEALGPAPPLYSPPSVTDAPPARPVSVTSIGIPPVNGSAVFVEAAPSQSAPVNSVMNAKLVIERGDSPGTEFRLSGPESTIGRWDADNGIFPDVDLDAFDQEAKVSRRHARIKIQEGRYMIEDLGSTNGTYVNRGRRLLPGNLQRLNDGDEVIVGKTFMRFHIIAQAVG